MSNLGNKEIMARNIKRLMELNGKDRNDVCKDLGFKYTTFTDWINANTYPRIDKIEMMANYFGVSKADLVEEKDDSEYYYDKQSAEMAQFLFDNPEYKVLFDASRKVKPEDIQFVADMINRVSNNDD
ncbi:MAG: XRE family transcriptional regulator [Pseudobutyrivibrio sp.]|nr:XRE family transcriptional regulator [Pseudobutyrivibrio sp.]